MEIRKVTLEGYTATIEPDRTVTIDRAGERIAEARWDEKRGMIYGDGGALTPAEIAEWSAALRATPPRPMTCDEIYARIGVADMELLTRWRELADEDSIHLGGRGRSRAQMIAAAYAWDSLSETARTIYFSMLYAAERELVAAIRKKGIPDHIDAPIDSPVDAIHAIYNLLGPSHPALQILSSHELVTLYLDAIQEVELELEEGERTT